MGLNVRIKATKCLEENIREKSSDFVGFGKDIFKKHFFKLDFIKYIF